MKDALDALKRQRQYMGYPLPYVGKIDLGTRIRMSPEDAARYPDGTIDAQEAWALIAEGRATLDGTANQGSEVEK